MNFAGNGVTNSNNMRATIPKPAVAPPAPLVTQPKKKPNCNFFFF
ncbi:hypothetical protein DDB_G0278833 [Dictyostelium discoideum AX4]|uniref:Uncharacterized protein n=1 Tax=Dictyostelium discoideum TaxID=44689 RepID=Q54XN4_DICDI|nr:hypothetical protein DDB_G0278833 [Dictyostelium discoideum AX4]EAL68018.1 hypothetical protein DDB_G0278833 [Dictyostelium discoideum AX4]|eukprot:XP_641996.1 hypothetical protein DDB_G0278833 [Dictyostelium discoideum AX4]